MDIKSFWENDNFKNIKPTNEDFPEGFDPRIILKDIISGIKYDTIVDFGCGYGRLCEAFPVEKYIGTDISDKAIEQACIKNSRYNFVNYCFPEADIYLAYTVFLHLDNNQLRQELKKIQTNYFVIAEILGKEWANNGTKNPPAYNRDDYCIMKEFGFRLVKEIKKSYKHFAVGRFSGIRNTDISFLLWKNDL